MSRKPDAAPERTGKSQNATMDQLRHQIDSGNAAEKVNYPDPAAAPLGTDEEAAGTRTQITRDDILKETGGRPSPQRNARGHSPWALVTAAIIAALLIVAPATGTMIASS